MSFTTGCWLIAPPQNWSLKTSQHQGPVIAESLLLMDSMLRLPRHWKSFTYYVCTCYTCVLVGVDSPAEPFSCHLILFCSSLWMRLVWPTSPHIPHGLGEPTTSWVTSLCTPSSRAGPRASWFPSGGFTWFSPGPSSPCTAWWAAPQQPRLTPQGHPGD